MVASVKRSRSFSGHGVGRRCKPLAAAVRTVVEGLEPRILFAGDGLQATYYDNGDFTGATVTRLDSTVNFDWGSGSPSASIGADTFSARWTGQVETTVAGTYTFSTTSDDGVRLWVNGTLLINNWSSHSATTDNAQIALAANTKYSIVMEYYEGGGSAVAKLAWTVPGGSSTIIPTANLYGATTLPAAPSNPSATATAYNLVTLTWTDNSDNEGGFQIERRQGASGAWVTVGTANPNTTSFLDSSTMPSTQYSYRVSAVNGVGASAPTTTVSVTTLATTAATGAFYETGGQVVMEGENYSSVSQRGDTVNWGSATASTGFAGAGYVTTPTTGTTGAWATAAEVAYNINFSTPGTYKVFLRRWAANTGSNSVFVGLNGTTNGATENNNANFSQWVWYQVGTVTVNAAGQHTFQIRRREPGYSVDRIVLTTGSAPTGTGPAESTRDVVPLPGAPTNLTTTPVSTTQIDLAWADNATVEDYFIIERKTGTNGTWGQVATVGANITNYSDTSLTAGTQYYYRVRAHNVTGDSANTSETSGTTLPNPPALPTNFNVATTSQTQLTLTWTDASNDEDGFKIERRQGAGGTWVQIHVTGANTTSYVDTGLTADTAYDYRLRATNAGGDSAYTSIVSATTLPNAPAAPSNLNVTTTSQTQLTLTWSDNANNEVGFKVERRQGAGSWSEIAQLGANVTSYVSGGLTAETGYDYRVRAYNTGGDSNYSNTASGTTLPNAPAAPGGLNVVVNSQTQLTLTWTDNSANETNFVIERKIGAGGTYALLTTLGANITTYADTGLTAATNYFYRVYATNAGGSSAFSAEANATTLPNAPAAPSGLTAASASATQVNLTWTDNAANETGFKLERKTGAAGTWSEIATPGANVTSYSDTGLVGGTQYFYRIRATNTGGDSAYSAEANATTQGAVTTNSATADGHTRGGTYGNDVYGTATQLMVKGSTDINFNRYAYITFSISNIGTIGSAKIRLFGALSGTVNNNVPITVYAVPTTTWSESTLNYNNQPATAGAGLATTTITDNTNRWYEWDVTAYVQAEKTAGRTAVSFQLAHTNGNTNDYTGFNSREAASNTPQLVVSTEGTIPAAPTSLAAVAASASQINLTWSDNSAIETGYLVERKIGVNGTWTQVGTPGANATSFSDTGLSSSTQYYYRVRATTGANQSAYSNESNATTLLGAPAAPSGLGAVAFSSTQINVSWTDNANNESGFKLERKTGVNGTWTQIATPGANVTTYADTGLNAATQYFYRVRATNAGGDSAYSAEANATTQAAAPALQFSPIASSYLGSNVSSDAVRATLFQADGTIVLVANIGSGTPGGLTGTLLNGATASTNGAIVRISTDGKTVLSVTRFAAEVADASLDAAGNIYVAARGDGLIKITADGTQMAWKQTGFTADRVDASSTGDVVVLQNALGADYFTPIGQGVGTVRVFNASGTAYGSAFNAHNQTWDVAIDSTTSSVFMTGHRQWNGPSGNPVQVAFVRSLSFTGTLKWNAYDWTGTQVDDPSSGGTGPTNNMADTRGMRLDVGADGKLYVAFLVAGGNHIFRYDPFNLFQTVSIVGGDQYHSFANSNAEHKTFFARYDAATGAYLRGQQFTARLQTGAANTAYIGGGGEIQADDQGRVYLAGIAGSGGGTNNTATGLPYTFNPVAASEYGGGPFLLVMSPDFTSRLFLGRVTSDGNAQSIGVATLGGESNPRIVMGGNTSSATLWTRNAIQSSSGGGEDGMFTVLQGVTTAPVAPSALNAVAVSSSQIQLTWSDNSNNEDSFIIERRVGVSGLWGTLATVGAGNASYVDAGLSPSTDYYYRIRSRNVVGDSGLSNEASATTQATASTPAAPSAATAVASSAQQVTITWTDNANNESGFKIERKTGVNGTWALIKTVGANITSYSDAPLTPSTTYVYRVTATNGFGDSAASNEATVTTRTIAGTGNFIETAGTVVLEAEHYMGASQQTDSVNWSVATSTVGFQGEGYITTPTAAQSGSWTTGAEVSYDITFSTTGTYAVWFRRFAVDQASNSAFPGLNGVTNGAYDNSGTNLNTWVWMQIGTLTVSSTGKQTFQIRRREPKYQIDRIVLTTGAGPTGNGPAESNRESGTVVTPATPTSINAVTVSTTQINVSWTDAAANEDYYRIERKTGANGTWSEIGTAPANGISYSDTGLAPGTQYFYRVRAANTAGNSAYTTEASATTVPLPPGAPSGLSAVATSPSQITLTWTDNASNESGFKIERKTGVNGTWVQIGNANANATTTTDNGLAPNTQYFYRIRATNSGGDSGYTNEANATTPAPTTVPSAPSSLAAVTAASNQINLTWTDNANSEDGFRIERKTGINGTWSQIQQVGADVTSYSDVGLTSSTQYYYRVRAYNVVGNGDYSGEANATTAAPAAPTTPNTLRVTGGWSSSVILAWNDTSGNETGFKIERSTDNFTWGQIGTANADTRTYTDNTTAANTTYYYRVRAYNVDGNSGYSNVTRTLTNLGDQVIVDNASYTGDWNGNSSVYAYGGNYFDDKNTLKGSNFATFTPNLPATGSYDVYIWNVVFNTNSTNTPVDINSATGTTTLVIDQKALTSKWNYLGTYTFNAGQGSVRIRTDGTNGFVISDAVRFVSTPGGTPTAPTSVAATTDTSSRITLTWTDVANEEAGYSVERSTDGVNFTEIAVIGPNATGYSSTALAPLTTYYYRIRAFNSAGSSSYSTVVSATTADESTEHLRLFITPAQVNQMKQDILVSGSPRQEMFNAMKARADANDWRAYDSDPNDGNKGFTGLMRSYLARENAMMYLLTNNATYAAQAYDALFQIYNNPDSTGNLLETGSSGLYRAMLGEGFAIAYDWCFAGWTTAQRDWVRGKIRAGLDAWPSYGHVNFASPYASNWNAVCRSGELIMMLAIPGEEVSRSDRFNFLKNVLIGHMNTAYGTSGWSQEGIGYASYALDHLVPAVMALRSIGDTSLDNAFNSKQWWRLFMTTGMFADQFKYAQTGVDQGVEGNLQATGVASLLLATAPSGQLPYYKWWYDRHMGQQSPLAAGAKYDFLRAGTTWAMLYYPNTTTAVDPDNNVSRTLADDGHGVYFFRNTWNDANDILVSSLADSRHDSRAWEAAETFNIGLVAYNTRFFGSLAKTTTDTNMSSLLVDGKAWYDNGDTGTTDYYTSSANGSGYLIVNGGSKYANLGLTSAKRHTYVDFSGVAAPLVMSTLDRLQSGVSHTYSWNINIGDELDNDNITVDIGSESGVQTFTLYGLNNSYVKGWVMTGGTLSGPGAVANGSLKVDVTGANADIWIVMLVGQGVVPTGSVTGSGMGATLTVNGATFSYNAASDRIVSGGGGSFAPMALLTPSSSETSDPSLATSTGTNDATLVQSPGIENTSSVDSAEDVGSTFTDTQRQTSKSKPAKSKFAALLDSVRSLIS